MAELAALADEGNTKRLGCDAGQGVARSRAVKDLPLNSGFLPLAAAPAPAVALIEIFERYANNNE